jgi:hypothetical protein
MTAQNGEMQPTQLSALTVHSMGKPVFTVTADGRIVIGESFNPEEASVTALRALAQQVPSFLAGSIALFCRGLSISPVTQALIRGALDGRVSIEQADRVFKAVSEQIAVMAEEAGRLMTETISKQQNELARQEAVRVTATEDEVAPAAVTQTIQ